jgi:hypothetical protein
MSTISLEQNMGYDTTYLYVSPIGSWLKGNFPEPSMDANLSFSLE